jgi:hypothetical protein
VIAGKVPFEDTEMPDEWQIIQAHVHQRHMDRWVPSTNSLKIPLTTTQIYRHDLIENRCWTDQHDSRHPRMKYECGEYPPTKAKFSNGLTDPIIDYNLSSVWEKIEQEADPYANPHFGNCLEKQLTKQGRDHSVRFGSVSFPPPFFCQ